ncbi:MAG: archease, partial [Anaerolineales bacterium]|nr:archease [Anaerolineales bacterium]
KEIEHTADYALKIFGSDIPELFIEAAKGMNSLTGAIFKPPTINREIKLDATDLESLLVAWLEELAFFMEVDNKIACDFVQIKVSDTRLNAKIMTCNIEGINKLVKAVTFYDMAIRQVHGGYETIIVFDV